MMKGVSMASKKTQKTGIDWQIPEKDILYTSPPEARSLDAWVREVEDKHATHAKAQVQSKTQRSGKSKGS